MARRADRASPHSSVSAVIDTPSAAQPTPAADSVSPVDSRAEDREADAALGRARRLSAGLGVGLVVVLLLIGLWQRGGGTVDRGTTAGQPAPDFQLTTFDGRVVRLADFRGRPLVLNFWASWCPPCRTEAASLQRVAAARADQVAFLGIDVRDDDADARAFLEEYGVTYTNGADAGQHIERAYGGIGIPFTVFISPDGIIERTWLGPLDERRLVAFIEDMS